LAEAAAAAAPAPAPAPGGAPHASNLDTQAAKVKGVAVKSQGSADAQSF
jgi:hypothetical protein